jgi:aerobic carbon-monoxide dehydrogenase large subunit
LARIEARLTGDVSDGYIGRRVQRAEDVELTSGRGLFCGDIDMLGLLDVAFHRSDRPHAEILSVDVREAQSIEGVREVLRAEDIGRQLDLHPRLRPPDREVPTAPRPLLAREFVRFVGEPVAAAVAESRYLAEDACDEVVVDYRNLPVVRDIEAAVAPDAPVVHPEIGSNVLFELNAPGEGIDQRFAAAAHLIERRYTVGRIAPCPLEPRGILAAPRDGGLEIWYSTQTPYVLRRLLSRLLGLSESQIRVICPHVGGGFGQKSHVYPEDVLIPWLALRHQAPVRWLEDRSENLLASCHARDQTIDVKAAVDADGRIRALDADIVVDVGAYGVYPHGQLIEVGGTPNLLSGPYTIDTVRFRARAVSTNKTPGGGFRGVGFAPAVFVHERLMDVIAHELSLTQEQVRRRNLITPEQLPWTNAAGMVYDSGDYPALLDIALSRVEAADLDVDRARASANGKRVGLGICCYVEPSGIGSNVFRRRGQVDIKGYEEARLTIELDGHVIVRPTVPNTGQGVYTALAQIVAEVLEQEIADVEVRRPDTSAGPDGSGAFASRGAVVGGAAALKASRTLRERVLEVAARQLRASVEELVLLAGRVEVIDEPRRSIGLGMLAKIGEAYLDVCERHDPAVGTIACGAHACVVEVDPEVGSVKILRYAIVGDNGRIINPMIVEGQEHGSTVQGIGAALLERFVFDDDGQPLTGSFMDYLLPTAADAPSFTVNHLEHRAVESPTGFKGAGESGCIAGPATIANAVANALGREVNGIPIAPEQIALGGEPVALSGSGR